MGKKEVIKIYTQDQEYAKAFYASKFMKVVNDPANADVILISSKKDMEKFSRLKLSTKVIFFTTSYKLLKQYPKILGAFYWRKGRSQLLFVKERLEKINIRLPKEYQKFIVETL